MTMEETLSRTYSSRNDRVEVFFFRLCENEGRAFRLVREPNVQRRLYYRDSAPRRMCRPSDDRDVVFVYAPPPPSLLYPFQLCISSILVQGEAWSAKYIMYELYERRLLLLLLLLMMKTHSSSAARHHRRDQEGWWKQIRA